MDYLQIALVVLAVAGVWAVVEVALTVRSARRDIEKVVSSATEVIGQAQPIVAKLDGVVDELEPAVKQVGPLLAKTEEAIGSVNVSLEHVNSILEDVSSVSGTASSVTGAVERAADAAVSGVAGVVSRLRGGSAAAPSSARLEASAPEEGAELPQAAPAPAPQAELRYVDYGEVSAAPESAQGAE